MRTSTHLSTVAYKKKQRTVNGLYILALILVGGIANSASAPRPPHKIALPKARLSDRVTVQAQDKGKPWVNLNDGYDLITSYIGPERLCQALEQNLARPLSLCSADYDEDGVADLIGSYAGQEAGIITLHRGNVDSIHPNAPEAKQRRAEGTFTESPFLSPAYVYSLPEGADFIGSGDFDADGHWDVVAARRGGDKLYLLKGDGRGGFDSPRQIDLQGKVTALTTGEINRRDGLGDLVLGVSGAGGAKVLVYEGPQGALRAKPEVFDTQADVTSVALGKLNDDYTMDLAIAAGRELIILQGRDRRLSLDESRQAQVPKPLTSKRIFPSNLYSITIGNFSDDEKTDVALLMSDGTVSLLTQRTDDIEQSRMQEVEKWESRFIYRGSASQDAQLARVQASSSQTDSVAIMDPLSSKINILNKSGENEERVKYPNIFSKSVYSVEDQPAAVLPMRLNGDALSDLVTLKRSKNSLALAMTAPQNIFTVTNTNDEGEGSLRQAMLNVNATLGMSAIVFNIPGDAIHVIKPVIQDNPVSPLPILINPVIIDATTQRAGLVELDGTNFSPQVRGSIFNGFIIAGGNSSVKGLVINRFGGSGIFITLKGGNIVEGNLFGTSTNGRSALGLGNGLTITECSNNLVGGTTTAARNLISGNVNWGITINEVSETIIQGNYVGTDITGSGSLGNGNAGIDINCNSENNTIGGTSPGSRNVVSGNGTWGVIMAGGANSPIVCGSLGTLVQGNFIGIDVTGSFAIKNLHTGIFLAGAASTVGGTSPTARNIISGNQFIGIDVVSPRATRNLLQGNFIGTDVTGQRDLGNGHSGVSITQAPDNTIGGPIEGARNIISGNDVRGIDIGILKKDPGSGEVFFGQTGAFIQGNFIGTNATGNAPLGNGSDGIFVDVESVDNAIEGNQIAFNGRNGVSLPNARPDPIISAHNIRILSNAIYSNNGTPIDLGLDGPTSNDPQDLDQGANTLQNFPSIASAMASGSNVRINGVLNSKPNSRFLYNSSMSVLAIIAKAQGVFVLYLLS